MRWWLKRGQNTYMRQKYHGRKSRGYLKSQSHAMFWKTSSTKSRRDLVSRILNGRLSNFFNLVQISANFSATYLHLKRKSPEQKKSCRPEVAGLKVGRIYCCAKFKTKKLRGFIVIQNQKTKSQNQKTKTKNHETTQYFCVTINPLDFLYQ